MVYTPTWKKNLIILCGLFENLVFTGNILGWSALNHMLKTEGVYDEFCYNELSIASSLNHTYLSSHLDDHPNDRNASLFSAKFNATLASLPDDYTTELPRFNTTNNDDYETNEEDELKNNGNREATEEENRTTTERPSANVDGENADEEFTNEKTGDNREKDEVTTTTEANEAPENAPENTPENTPENSADNAPENAENDDPSESATGADSESISRIKNVPSITTTLPAAAPVRSKRDNSRTDSDPGKNGPTSQLDPLTSHRTEPHAIRRNCKKQDTVLNLAYTIGTFLNGFTAFVWGFLLDKWGLRKVRLLINFFLSAGCCLLCFTSKDYPHLIFPSIALLCLGGVPLRIADMQFANLYPKIRSSIITLYSGAFSASSIVFVFVKFGYEHGIDYYYATGILFLVSLLILPATFFLLPEREVREDDSKPPANEKDPGNHAAFTIENKRVLDKDAEDYCQENGIKFSRQNFNRFYAQNFNTIQPIQLEKFQYIGSPQLKRKENGETDRTAPVELDAKIMVNAGAQGVDKLDLPLTKLDNTKEKKKPEPLPLKLSLYSLPYIVHQYWFCWLITYMIMYVGSMNLWIRRITEDSAKASLYLKIYGLLQVFSLILAPMAGAIMDYEVNKASKEKDPHKRRLKMAKAAFWPVLLTNLSLTGVIICKFFDHEIAIYISIVLNTFLRSFLIAVASAYLRIRFPAEHFAKLLGIMSTIGAVMTMIQFPIFIWEASSPEQAVWVNTFNAFMTALSFSNPILMLITPLQEKIIRKQQKLESLYKN